MQYDITMQGSLTDEEYFYRQSKIADEMVRLRLAYPVQARNYSEEEVSAMNYLWSSIFISVEPCLFSDAIIRFIIKDRRKVKLFPSPGDITEVVEQIIRERKPSVYSIAIKRKSQLIMHRRYELKGEKV